MNRSPSAPCFRVPRGYSDNTVIFSGRSCNLKDLIVIESTQRTRPSHTSPMRILIAEDEKKVAHFIRKALREAGHAVDEVYDGNAALKQALTTPYDAIILDVMMPGRDGLSVLRILREERTATPVLLLTARGEVSERIEGLNLGADDYMAKPFAMGELIARINALTRRVTGERTTLLRVEDLIMNLVNREVTRAGQGVALALREFALLEFLMRSPGRVLSRTTICEHVWDHHFDTGTNVVDVYIQRLRRKIDDEHEVRLLHTIRGVGYMLRGAS
jgi:DNA-binding response OmpR family regulator